MRYNTLRTQFGALAAIYAEISVDTCEKIVDTDRRFNLGIIGKNELARLVHADLASDTADSASLFHDCALLLVAALDVNFLHGRSKAYQHTGTGFTALAAAGALLYVNFGKPVVTHRNRIKRTGPDTVPQPEAAVRTDAETAPHLLSRRTGERPLIFKFIDCIKKTALTVHPGQKLDKGPQLDTHYGSDFRGAIRAADRAKINIRARSHDFIGVSPAPGKAARTAICTGKCRDNLIDSRILFNVKFLFCDRKNNAEEQPQRGDARSCDDYLKK